jgi:hypothetical protein
MEFEIEDIVEEAVEETAKKAKKPAKSKVSPKYTPVTAKYPEKPVKSIRVGRHPGGGWCLYEYTILNGQIIDSKLTVDDDRASALHLFKVAAAALYFEDAPEQ